MKLSDLNKFQLNDFYSRSYDGASSQNRQKLVYYRDRDRNDIRDLIVLYKKPLKSLIRDIKFIEKQRLVLTGEIINIFEYISIMCSKTTKNDGRFLTEKERKDILNYKDQQYYKESVKYNYNVQSEIMKYIKKPENSSDRFEKKSFISCTKLKQLNSKLLEYFVDHLNDAINFFPKLIKNGGMYDFLYFIFYSTCFEMKLFFKHRVRVLFLTYEFFGIQNSFLLNCFAEYSKNTFGSSYIEHLKAFLTYTQNPNMDPMEDFILEPHPNYSFEIPKKSKRKSTNKLVQPPSGKKQKTTTTTIVPPPHSPTPSGFIPPPGAVQLPELTTPRPKPGRGGNQSQSPLPPPPSPFPKDDSFELDQQVEQEQGVPFPLPPPSPQPQPVPKPSGKRSTSKSTSKSTSRSTSKSSTSKTLPKSTSYRNSGFDRNTAFVREDIEFERSNLFEQFQNDWGIKDDNIDDNIVNQNQPISTIYAKLKPKLSNDETIGPILEENPDEKDHLIYNCAENKQYQKEKRIKRYDSLKFSQVYGSEAEMNAEHIFKTSVLPNLNKDKNLFIAAYGQSGSGKSYLMLGDEKNSAVKGIIDYTMDTMTKKKKNIEYMTLLPLQIYKGSVYNAFHGPPENDSPGTAGNIIKWFEDPEKHSQFKIFELNYIDMLRKNEERNKRYPPKVGLNGGSKTRVDVDRMGIFFPPAKKMIMAMLSEENSSDMIDNILDGSKSSLDITDLNTNELKLTLFNQIRRPTRNTAEGKGFNTVSSRSHLFTMIYIQYKDGKDKLITFADFAGLESQANSGRPGGPETPFDKEKRYLITYDLKTFRRMFQMTKRSNFAIPPSSGSLPNHRKNPPPTYLFSHESTKNPLIATDKNINAGDKNPFIKGRQRLIDADNNGIYDRAGNLKFTANDSAFNKMQPSGMFNILRAVTGCFSETECEHMIFGTFYKYATDENVKSICNTTNTVLKFTKEFLEGDKKGKKK